MSAIGNVGTVVGALGASALWRSIDLGLGLCLASTATALAGAALFFVPAPGRGTTMVQAAAS